MTNRLWPFGCALPGGLRGTEETDSRREGEGKVEGREGCRCSAFAKDGGSTVISQGGDNGREGEGGEGNNGDSGRTHQRDQWGLSSDE
jgi:type II secretory pathway pseudopilin PulG